MRKRVRHFAPLQADRYNEYSSILKHFCLFQRDLQLFMAVSRLLTEFPCKTDKDHVAVENRPADLMLPILARLKVLRVQPGIDPIPDNTLMKFSDSLLVTMCINKEDVHLLYRPFHSLSGC